MADKHCTGTWCPSEGQAPDHPLLPLHCVSETSQRLAKNVRLLRIAHGWSQEVLAELADLNRSFVGSIERAEHNVTLATVEKIARAFEMTVVDLLTPYDVNNR